MNSQSLILGPAAKRLFDWARSKGASNIQATVSTNVEYAIFQEYGTKRMAAHPMLGPYLGQYRQIVEDCLREGMAKHPRDPVTAATYGINLAAVVILGHVAEHSPVDTGRLKGSWTATLAGGKKIDPSRVITASEAKILRKANAKRRRTEARKGREAAKKAGA